MGILELVKVDNFVFIRENIGVVHHNRYYVDSLSESLKSGVTKWYPFTRAVPCG